MSIYIYTERFIFSCTDEGKRVSCLKFGVDGQFFRAISINQVGNKYYIIDDKNKEIRASDTMLNVLRKYIYETYGRIEDVFVRD